jgi:DNA transformation protein
MSDAIDHLPNLGPFLTRRLAEIDVHDVDALRALGAVEAYARLKFRFGREITLNALWGMDAALAGIDWRSLSDRRKSELKEQFAARQASRPTPSDPA